jgi:hypothetical protein
MIGAIAEGDRGMTAAILGHFSLISPTAHPSFAIYAVEEKVNPYFQPGVPPLYNPSTYAQPTGAARH